MKPCVKIGILGAEGRMGRALLSEIETSSEAELVSALTLSSSPNLGKAYGPVHLTADIGAALSMCDVLIDFSHPKAAIDAALMMHGTACKTLVSGTTGYSETEEAALIAAAEAITLVKSGNFSVGICVLEALVKQAASTLRQDTGTKWDASVLDIHHRNKKDAPSGTALMLGHALMEGDSSQNVAFADQRIGGVIGEHHVSLANPFETLTLSHTAVDRSVFAAGALGAALWAVGKPVGLYAMHDVLGL